MPPAEPVLSVVVPARNEAASLAPLVGELRAALDGLDSAWEIVVVDDASTDDTRGLLAGLAAADARVRALVLPGRPGGRLGHGQSAALAAGIARARGRLIATIDGDGQNDPADLAVLVEAMRTTGADLVQGDRTGRRRERAGRRVATASGRLLQRVVLGVDVRDSGCGLRVMRREVARTLPLAFAGMHRFVPALATDLGFTVVRAPVRQRTRTGGRSKYGLLGRALIVPVDCLVLRWMRSRRRRPAIERLEPRRGGDVVPVTGTPGRGGAVADSPVVETTPIRPGAGAKAGEPGTSAARSGDASAAPSR